MLAVTTPEAPLFQEHYNPSTKMVVMTSCPTSGDCHEFTISFSHYFGAFGDPQDEPEFQAVMKAFDIHGYYETVTICHDTGTKYPTTLYPITNNSITS
tara:strand:+ start:407 stop:700 length:294 start_codon:yes stop_codon:yes gene_type:complete